MKDEEQAMEDEKVAANQEGGEGGERVQPSPCPDG